MGVGLLFASWRHLGKRCIDGIGFEQDGSKQFPCHIVVIIQDASEYRPCIEIQPGEDPGHIQCKILPAEPSLLSEDSQIGLQYGQEVMKPGFGCRGNEFALQDLAQLFWTDSGFLQSSNQSSQVPCRGFRMIAVGQKLKIHIRICQYFFQDPDSAVFICHICFFDSCFLRDPAGYLLPGQQPAGQVTAGEHSLHFAVGMAGDDEELIGGDGPCHVVHQGFGKTGACRASDKGDG